MQCMYKCGLYYRTAHTHIRDTSSWCTCFCRDFVHSPSHTIMYNRNFRKTYFIRKNRNAVFSIKKRNKYGKNGTVGISASPWGWFLPSLVKIQPCISSSSRWTVTFYIGPPPQPVTHMGAIGATLGSATNNLYSSPNYTLHNLTTGST